ncbi:MAG: hypothetical protein M1339_00755, partial [Bacteroidetes bacterium]|nr:hypothetical protein [Bacteroidota bacterium]
MKKLAYLLVTISLVMLVSSSLAHAQTPDPALAKRVPVSTVSASLLDYTQNEDYTGNVSLPIPLVKVGDEQVELKYYSQGVAEKVRTENQYAPSGEVGLGWQLLYGSISGEINGSADTSDDKYYYNGPNGSFQLQEGVDGVFRIPNYKPWKFQRVMNGDIIAGWIVTKPDGTILRFGNYTGTQWDTNNDPPYATRFFLGINGLVANPDPSLYGNLQYIPYQWDLSSVQNLKGNVTSLSYQQVNFPLVADDTSSATYGWDYTRGSHLSEILDNKGQEVDFTYAPMTSTEYYDNFTSHDQNLVDTLYLDSIKIKGDDQLYKQIIFSDNTSDILNLGIVKRYLTELTIEDGSGNPLPSYNFTYYGVDGVTAGYNPGALQSATDMNGGKVTYTYKPQSLPNVSLSTVDTVDTMAYWTSMYESPDGGGIRPSDDGIAGKNFVVVRSKGNRLKVYRLGPTGWYHDTTFPDSTANYLKVCNNFVVLIDPSVPATYAIKLTQGGWVRYDVGALIQQAGGNLNWLDVAGTGNDYFVVKYNQQQAAGSWPPLYNYTVAIVTFTAQGLKIDPLGTYWDGTVINSSDPNYGQTIPMRAFCGQNLMVLESSPDGDEDAVFNYFKFSSPTNWAAFATNIDPQNYDGPDIGTVQIGKTFVVCSLDFNSLMKAYMYSGSQLVQVDDVDYSNSLTGGSPDIVVGDDYYAFTGDEGGGYSSVTAYIRTWDPNTNGFKGTDFMSLYPGIYGGGFSLLPLGNRLIVSWTSYNNGTSSLIAYTTHSPNSGSWLPAHLIDSTSEATGAGAISCLTGLSNTAFAEMTYDTNYASLYPNPNSAPPVPIKVYQFSGNSISSMTIASFPLKYAGTVDGYPYNEYEQPQYWVLQPGEDFIALSRSAGPDYFLFSPDSVNMFTFHHNPDGSIQFTGTPTVPVLYQRIVEDGMGNSSTYTYSFDSTTGIFNQYLTPEYENVTETLPGSNGKISTSYYVEKDSSA